MDVDINVIINIFTQKIAEKEKENVLLQAHINELQKQIIELKNNQKEDKKE